MSGASTTPNGWRACAGPRSASRPRRRSSATGSCCDQALSADDRGGRHCRGGDGPRNGTARAGRTRAAIRGRHGGVPGPPRGRRDELRDERAPSRPARARRGAGDEVLMPSYTCVAVTNAVRYVGATPALADIDPHTYNLDAGDARRRLTAATRAVIVPHMFGLPADMDPLTEWGIPVIEDCAQTLGATYRGRRVGGFGTVSICSFYATKLLTTGEGGMLLSDSDTLVRRARDLRDYDDRADATLRYNYKMTDFQAALGVSQLGRLPQFLARREALAARYEAALRGLP